MIEKTETPSKKPANDVMPAKNASALGNRLRESREALGLTIEDVSKKINIRAVQLRAIEEGNLAALPGMIYATGFVKNYANFLKLDPVDAVKTFKAEQGVDGALKSDLQFPEPMLEDKLPTPQMLAVAGGALAVVFVLWAFFSGGGKEDSKTVAVIPEPPAVEQAIEQVVATPPDIVTPAPDAVAPALPIVAETPTSSPSAPVVSPIVEKEIKAPAPAVAPMPATAPTEQVPHEPVAETLSESLTAEIPPSEIIEIKPRGRVVLTATESAWVQITDASGNTIYKKVMRAGEKYTVPNKPGLSLMTSNAGGIAVFVDGSSVQAIGRKGDIVRGVDLDADSLKKKRFRVRDY